MKKHNNKMQTGRARTQTPRLHGQTQISEPEVKPSKNEMLFG